MRASVPLSALVPVLSVAILASCASSGAGPDPDGGHGQEDGAGAPPVVATGATLDGADIEGRPVVQVEELLIGRFPGVRVFRQPGGGIEVRVWGPGSLTSNEAPLYVVDGMPVMVAPGRGLDWLNPGDIARIEVLKDVSETSAYGVRGANGVVLITTRHGSRDGRPPR